MNDVLALAPGQWQWNGWLNPKGRVIALFALLRVRPDRYLAILPDFPATELLPLLQRFVFRTKVRLRVADDLLCAAAFDQDVPDSLDFSGSGGNRQLLLLPVGSPAATEADAAVDARWRALDIVHGLPRLPDSQREAWTPQMLSLERLKAYSLKKGCYPGQEIVARTHYLGQAKRRLARLEGDGLAVGADVRTNDGPATGTIVCVGSDGREGLAVVSADARPAGELPLLNGLERPL